jgi:hypothetical protein
MSRKSTKGKFGKTCKILENIRKKFGKKLVSFPGYRRPAI